MKRVAPDLSIDDAELGVAGKFTSPMAPVQAAGTVAGWPFYFRARWDTWTFAVSMRAGLDPAEIHGPEAGFFRTGKHGVTPQDASYMPLDEARHIIQKCCRELIAELGG